ncbi:MAG: hypothetical protein GY842_06220 [bacterium]|nr:hypothetical protein [bacterium]
MERVDSKANTRERTWIQHVLSRIYAQTLRRGFHGQVTLTITVQDGTIQHTRHAVEEDHRRPE